MTNDTFIIDIYRDEAGYWIADVTNVPGAHTFGKRLDQAIGNAVEAICLALDVDRADIVGSQIETNIALPGDIQELIDELKDSRAAAETAAEAASEASRRAARQLVNEGYSLRDAGQLLGVSHQRIGQLVKS